MGAGRCAFCLDADADADEAVADSEFSLPLLMITLHDAKTRRDNYLCR